MTARLSLRDVACVRGGRLLFEALTLELNAGEAALVTGPNGAGKSSLLRLAAGLLTPSAGTVLASPGALADGRAALDHELPLARALDFWARVDGVGADAVEAALDRFALTPLRDVPVRLLSTGQRQRAVLARVMAGGRALWLLDEPANGLDAASCAVLDAAVAEHRAGGGIAVVATHIPVALPGAVGVAL